MDENSGSSTTAEADVSVLRRLVLRNKYAMIHQLSIEEIPQSFSSEVALLNVTGRSDSLCGEHVGLCVMVVGLADPRQILWACCLMAQHNGPGSEEMVECLLVAPEVIGKTKKIAIRVYGGRLSQEGEKSTA